MKRRTSWTLGLIVALCFIALLLLQVRYIDEMNRLRRTHFDELVGRALYQVSRQMEHAEIYTQLQIRYGMPFSPVDFFAPGGLANSYLDMSTQFKDRAEHQFSDLFGTRNGKDKTLQNEIRQLLDAIRHRYYHRKDIIEGVIADILSIEATDKPLTRADFRRADRYLRSELQNNGILIPYHFTITDNKHNEVYRCLDYDAKGIEETYVQPLYQNQIGASLCYLRVHFPGKDSYLSASFMYPSLFFTTILLIVCTYVIFFLLRQKKISKMKSDFISNMTHELKTPISSISLASQMLQDPAVIATPTLSNRATMVIRDEAKRLQFQVEKVLQMSLFERQAAKMNLKEVALNALTENVIETFRLKVEGLGGSITTHLEAVNDKVYIDEMHLSNILFNLMDNAVKYSEPTRPIKLTVTTRNNETDFTLSLRDNGIGINRDDAARIFDKFYRVSTGNLHDVKGFGLGLTYVKKIIKELGGNIRVDSQLGQGSTFIITLPLLTAGRRKRKIKLPFKTLQL